MFPNGNNPNIKKTHASIRTHADTHNLVEVSTLHFKDIIIARGKINSIKLNDTWSMHFFDLQRMTYRGKLANHKFTFPNMQIHTYTHKTM